MKKILFYFLTYSLSFVGVAQVKTVDYSAIKNQLNGGQPLPSEESFIIQGRIPSSVRLVTLDVAQTGKSPQSGNVYTWKTP